MPRGQEAGTEGSQASHMMSKATQGLRVEVVQQTPQSLGELWWVIRVQREHQAAHNRQWPVMEGEGHRARSASCQESEIRAPIPVALDSEHTLTKNESSPHQNPVLCIVLSIHLA